jgi:5'-nucleotidase
MRILLSNDDGYTAPGLRCLRDALIAAGHTLEVVAPDRNRSGASNSLTLLRPLRPQQMPDRVWSVDGTPTDCVHLALAGGLLGDFAPDMVVSGINAGANLGDDTLYSGTVAAAMEGRHLGCAAVAVSCINHDPQHYETAAAVTVRLVSQLALERLPGDTILNVNVPDVPLHQIEGYEVTRLGARHRSQDVTRSADPRGRPIYWIGVAGAEVDCGPGTDFHAVVHRRVSITPISVDLTRHAVIDRVRDWVAAL